MLFYLKDCKQPESIVKAYFSNEKKGKEKEKSKKLDKTLFSGKEGEVFGIPSIDDKSPHVILLGLGKKEEMTRNKLRILYAKAASKAKEWKAEKILLYPAHSIESQKDVLETKNSGKKSLAESIGLPEQEVIQAIVEGMNLTDYKFTNYKPDKTPYQPEVYFREPDNQKESQKALTEAKNLTDSMKDVKDLITLPTNDLYPEILANWAVGYAKETGFEIEVLEKPEIEKLGMGAYLAVGQGTKHEPRLIIMKYHNNKKSKEIFGLVGKGLTCDTGGYSIKSHESLKYMKADMSGAAYMIATMGAIARNKLKVNVTAVVAASENVLSGDSYKPGDVVKSMAGKTIEVLNTDAEGRLTLADAVHYIIKKENAAKIIDMATLTGQAGATFGNIYTPLFSNNDEFCDAFLACAKETGEDFWRMPSDKRYHHYIDSDIADIKNTGDAGTITAAAFIQDFVGDTPWIHLDIAGTAAQYPAVFPYAENCPSAIAVRTIYELIKKNKN